MSRERERGFGGSSFPKVQKEAMMNNEHCGWVSLLKRKKKAEREGGQVFVVIDVLECVSASKFLPHFFPSPCCRCFGGITKYLNAFRHFGIGGHRKETQERKGDTTRFDISMIQSLGRNFPFYFFFASAFHTPSHPLPLHFCLSALLSTVCAHRVFLMGVC